MLSTIRGESEAPSPNTPTDAPKNKWGSTHDDEIPPPPTPAPPTPEPDPDSLRVSPVKLGHHTHQPHPIFYTVGEEKAIARAKKEKEEEKRRKQFTALLNKTSPSTKRKKKNVLLKKIIKRSIDDSGTGEKMSDKMAGYVGNVSGLITLPDRGSTECA
jgi:hypothetical protein